MFRLLSWAFEGLGFQQGPGYPNRIVRDTDQAPPIHTSLTKSCIVDNHEAIINVYWVPGTVLCTYTDFTLIITP